MPGFGPPGFMMRCTKKPGTVSFATLGEAVEERHEFEPRVIERRIRRVRHLLRVVLRRVTGGVRPVVQSHNFTWKTECG